MSRRALAEARRMLLRERVPTGGRTDYTGRNRALLEAGVHPATRGDVRADLGTCGECRHHVIDHRNRRYHKCRLHRLGISSSEASDIRVSWPACDRFERGEG